MTFWSFGDKFIDIIIFLGYTGLVWRRNNDKEIKHIDFKSIRKT